jgi:hypothetical protein
MGIHKDWTQFSKVVWCDCGWTDVAVSDSAAYSMMADHEERSHPDSWRVRKSAWQRSERNGGNVEMD